MYERFTDRVRKVMKLASAEANRFGHEYIGTEHLLLGLVKEGSSVAANVLKNLDIDLRKIRLEVEKIVQSGPDMVTMGKLPQTPKVKKVIEYAIEEARNLNHNYVGTEHLLLGLLREGDNVAAIILTMKLGLKLEDVRKKILQTLGYEIASEEEHIGRTVVRRWSKAWHSQEIAMLDCYGSSSQGEAPLFTERERIRSLEQQIWNVRVVLGALVGAVTGTLLLAPFGAIMGLLLGGLVAALGWRTLSILAGGIMGVLLGCTHLPDDGGGLAGALLGALAGFLIAEIGAPPNGCGFVGFWQKR